MRGLSIILRLCIRSSSLLYVLYMYYDVYFYLYIDIRRALSMQNDCEYQEICSKQYSRAGSCRPNVIGATNAFNPSPKLHYRDVDRRIVTVFGNIIVNTIGHV